MTRHTLRAGYAILCLLLIATLAAPLAFGQTPGLRREQGTIYTKGTFVEMTAGAAIAANDAVYLSATASTVLKLPVTGQRDTLFGVAPYACASGSTTCAIQISGKATVVSDAAIAVGDRVGAPTSTAGRVKTLAANSGDARLTLGRALTSASGAAESLTILLERTSPGPAGLAQDVILCGQQANAGTIYMGPASGFAAAGLYSAGLTANDLSYAIGGTGCDALDNATEATADAPLYANNAFRVLGMFCEVSSSGANGVALTLRSAAADLSPTATCTVATGATTCAVALATPATVAAGATFALKVVNTEDLSLQDAWCSAKIEVVP